jgi:hypothetical protein
MLIRWGWVQITHWNTLIICITSSCTISGVCNIPWPWHCIPTFSLWIPVISYQNLGLLLQNTELYYIHSQSSCILGISVFIAQDVIVWYRIKQLILSYDVYIIEIYLVSSKYIAKFPKYNCEYETILKYFSNYANILQNRHDISEFFITHNTNRALFLS